MELDTSYIVLTMAQAHDLSFFRIDRRDFQTIREVFLGDRPRMITPNTYTRFQSLEDRIFSDNPYIGANAVMHIGKVYQCGAECLALYKDAVAKCFEQLYDQQGIFLN